MSRGTGIRIWRPTAVWATVTAGGVAAAQAVPGAWSAVDGGSAYDGVVALLVAACSTGLALALAWLWVITTLTVAGLLTDGAGDGSMRPCGGATRRLVLLACGAAVVAATSAPAMATGGDGRDLLAGLTLPERAVAPPRAHRAPRAHPRVQAQAQTQTSAQAPYVVLPGDSLWSIAHDHPDGSASVDQRWRSIWLANRDVVGDDPDLIIPGQALRLPTSNASQDHATQDPNSDGDR